MKRPNSQDFRTLVFKCKDSQWKTRREVLERCHFRKKNKIGYFLCCLRCSQLICPFPGSSTRLSAFVPYRAKGCKTSRGNEQGDQEQLGLVATWPGGSSARWQLSPVAFAVSIRRGKRSILRVSGDGETVKGMRMPDLGGGGKGEPWKQLEKINIESKSVNGAADQA